MDSKGVPKITLEDIKEGVDEFLRKCTPDIEARVEPCDFDILYKGKKWHIHKAFTTPAGERWYAGFREINGIVTVRSFAADEVDVPEVFRDDQGTS